MTQLHRRRLEGNDDTASLLHLLKDVSVRQGALPRIVFALGGLCTAGVGFCPIVFACCRHIVFACSCPIARSRFRWVIGISNCFRRIAGIRLSPITCARFRHSEIRVVVRRHDTPLAILLPLDPENLLLQRAHILRRGRTQSVTNLPGLLVSLVQRREKVLLLLRQR